MKKRIIICFCLMTVLHICMSTARGDGLVINEFMAINDATLQDEDMDYSDWIEIYNSSNAAINLNGWYLTDRTNDLTKWQFPSTNIQPNAFLVVFASGKDRSVAGSELHTGFKLSGDGEYLGLVKPDGLTIEHEYLPEFPVQTADISFGISGGSSNILFVPDEADCTAIVPTDDTSGTNWHLVGFNDSAWTNGTTGVGYDTGTRYDPLIDIDLQNDMHNVNGSAYIRIPFEVYNVSNIVSLTLRMKFDDGFAAYLNGTKIASSNAPALPAWDSLATGEHFDDDAVIFVDYDISVFITSLREGTNMLAIQSFNRTLSSSDLLMLPELECWYGGTGFSTDLRYFQTPTPGAENTSGTQPLAEPVVFSIQGGVFTEPVVVELYATNSAEKIYYTLDGTEPTISSLEYSGTITNSSTTIIRARSFETGYSLGPVNSEVYLFLSNDSIRTFSSDLPIVVVDNLGGDINIPDDVYQSSCLAFFEPGGDERTTLTNGVALSTRAGIRRRGESSLRPTDQKPNLAVESWSDGADVDSNIAPFEMPAESDWILHAPYNFDRACIRNAFIFDLSNQIDSYAVRTRFVEVFLNYSGGDLSEDDYAGLYVFMEKIKRDNDRVDVERMTPLDNSEPKVSGGYIMRIDKTDLNQTHLSGMTQGSLYCIYPTPVDLTSQQKDYIEDYIIDFEDQLYNPDPTNGYAKYIDVPNFIDHNLLNMLPMNVDGLRLSTYISKPRSGKLQMGPIWDFDRSMESTDYRDDDPETWHGPWDASYYIEPDLTWRGYWWGQLFKNADFWQLYIDRWQELRQNRFSETNINATIDSMADEIEEARARDIDKWHQNPRNDASPFLDGTQQGEIDYLKWWLGARADWVDDQFISAPVLSHKSGYITNNLILTMTQTSGSTNLYTLDGSDPRAAGGMPLPSSIAYTGAVEIVGNAIIRARAWDGTVWSSNPPAEAPWSGQAEAIYISDLPTLAVTEIMYNPGAPFSPGETNYSASDFEFIELKNIGNDTNSLVGVEFTDGITFDFTYGNVDQLTPGDFVVIVKNMAAFTNRYTNWASINIAGEYNNLLNNDGESIILEMPSVSEVLTDFEYNDSWHPNTGGEGFSLNIINALGTTQSWSEGSAWRPSSFLDGTPGEDDPFLTPVPGSIVINEILTHQDQDNPGDWIELYNTSTNSLDIDGWFISDDKNNLTKLQLTNIAVIASGAYLTLTEQDHFGTNAPGVGTNGFALSEIGENLYISSASNGIITGYREEKLFGAADNSVTFGRYFKSDSSCDFTAMSRATTNQANAYPLVGPITINEIAYCPQNSNSFEFIELYNSSNNIVNLFDPLYPGNTWKLTGGVDFVFPTNTVISATNYLLLIPVTEAAFLAQYTNVPAGTSVLGPYNGQLNNGGESICLYKPGPPDGGTGVVPYILVDRVDYDNESPWPVSAAGGGASLERRVPGEYGNDSINWSASFINATPGRTAEDADYDGMLDTWEVLYFASTTNNNGGSHADWDGDGFINLYEYLADTVPTNSVEFLGITDIDSTTGTIVRWQSSADKCYSIERATNLINGFNYVVASNIAAQAPLNSYTIEVDQIENVFYRITLDAQ